MFGKNKNKVDSKIRFQNSRFRQQLKQARGYKRSVQISPQTDWQKLLAKVGLGSWITRLVCLAVFLLLIYVAFIPNAFYVKKTTLNGANGSSYQAAQNLIQSYLDKKTPWPQKNLILLSTNGLKNFLLQNDRQILSVDSISKQYPSTLAVQITPRTDMFELQTASSTIYTISNDGIITNTVPEGASSSLPSNLILIKLTSNPVLSLGDRFLMQSDVNFITSMQSQLPAIIKSPLSYYELDSPQSQNLNAISKTGFTLKLDLLSDAATTIQRIALIFDQYSSGDIKNLAYVDMRFKGRGYACFINTPCDSAIIIPQTAPTSTPVQ